MGNQKKIKLESMISRLLSKNNMAKNWVKLNLLPSKNLGSKNP